MTSTLYVAARRCDDKTPFTDRLVTLCMDGDVIHVELVFPVACERFRGRPVCEHCQEYNQKHPRHQRVLMAPTHHLTYSIHKGKPPHNTVFRAIDKNYRRQGIDYRFLALTVTPEQSATVHTFMIDQLNKPLRRAYLCEILKRLCVTHCIPRPMYKPLSTHERDSWFCSEVVTAALQQIGLCTELDPGTTDPVLLWDTLQESPDCRLLVQPPSREVVTATPATALNSGDAVRVVIVPTSLIG